ncbi:pyridoxamine 5'-phosphate oxidase [Streptomyces solincola]|uniref:Pyridoxamine 5'-phosphate oxidase n=1 Tax=Streptomyces solincola TaxID=2100817 RepID=A0A2S9Q267_9ACTN|nr:pyridoxamine 5'-phosphate oxidase family protein [Streptomyces solincola]PRH80761.1 pyridoxamine 5'-phosphate oxidase [Streptomyces solincola]
MKDWKNAREREDAGGRRLRRLGRDEALLLLGGASSGRLVFTEHALPAVRPARHELDSGDLVVRLWGGQDVLPAPALSVPLVVAYEADAVDPATSRGWSVVVTGYARTMADGTGAEPACTSPEARLRIRPELVVGYRLN